jgi:cell division septum initiation protein DivIVA
MRWKRSSGPEPGPLTVNVAPAAAPANVSGLGTRVEQILRSAEDEARSLVAAAERQADQIVSDARAEAARILEQAHAEAATATDSAIPRAAEDRHI